MRIVEKREFCSAIRIFCDAFQGRAANSRTVCGPQKTQVRSPTDRKLLLSSLRRDRSVGHQTVVSNRIPRIIQFHVYKTAPLFRIVGARNSQIDKNSFALSNDMGVESPFPLKLKTDDEQEETLSINVDNRNLMYKIVHDDCSVSALYV